MKVLLVDDHALFRQGFKLMLEGVLDGAFSVVEAGDAESGLAVAGEEFFDLLFLDMGLPGLGGLDGVRVFRERFPETSLIVLSGIDGPEVVRRALSMGAQGYIPKSVSVEDMRQAVLRILDGEVVAPDGADGKRAGAGVSLTSRQIEVLGELCAGKSNREIAESLCMTDNTVKVHVSAIFRTLGVRSRTEAVLLAKRRGLF